MKIYHHPWITDWLASNQMVHASTSDVIGRANLIDSMDHSYLADVSLQTFESIHAEHKPHLQRAKSTTQWNLPVLKKDEMWHVNCAQDKTWSSHKLQTQTSADEALLHTSFLLFKFVYGKYRHIKYKQTQIHINAHLWLGWLGWIHENKRLKVQFAIKNHANIWD